MIKYALRRLVQAIFVVWGAATVVFFILRLSGDPIALLIPDNATPAQIEQIRENYGFNDPIYVQYARFLGRAAAGDFGTSIRFKQPAMSLVLERLPATVELALVSLVLSLVISVPVGVFAALKRNTASDHLSMVAALLGQSVPPFWLGVIFILIFAVRLKWLPTSGRGELTHLILPSVSLAAYSMARLTRVTRSSMLDILGQDYIRTARAKGLHERTVIFVHALRNAAITITTMTGLMFASLIGGAIVVELVFAWPGMGRLMVQAVSNRDYPVAQAAVFVIAIFVALINLTTDLVYAYLDPRIKYK